MEYERNISIRVVGKGKLKKIGKDLTSSELFSVPDGKVKPFIETQCCCTVNKKVMVKKCMQGIAQQCIINMQLSLRLKKEIIGTEFIFKYFCILLLMYTCLVK